MEKQKVLFTKVISASLKESDQFLGGKLKLVQNII